MKKTIKLFMIAAAILFSGNLFAQTVADYQNRLHDLQLCHDYLSRTLTPEQMATVDKEIEGIEAKLQSLNAPRPTFTPFDNYVMSNGGEPAVMEYIKFFAICTEPVFLLGRELTPAEKSSYASSLGARATSIASTHKF